MRDKVRVGLAIPVILAGELAAEVTSLLDRAASRLLGLDLPDVR